MQAAGEFDLIARYFTPPPTPGIYGVGDDCALLSVAQGFELAVSTDMLVEGRHFLPDVDPEALGHKALAVNLSDLAAMGARPLGCTLALSLPRVDAAWLQGFSTGFHALSRSAGCPLVGGDTTRSVQGVVISITVLGEVRRNRALRRNTAQAGDDIWVSGTLGAAYIALFLLQGRLPPDPDRLAATRAALQRPTPRLTLGRYLGGIAHAAIDISDGLIQDLGHILDASRRGAELWLERFPAHPGLTGLDDALRREAIMAGGDVYELCFTARPRRREQIRALARQLDVPLTRIGTVVRAAGLRVLDADGEEVPITYRGFDHFKAGPDSAPIEATPPDQAGSHGARR